MGREVSGFACAGCFWVADPMRDAYLALQQVRALPGAPHHKPFPRPLLRGLSDGVSAACRLLV